MTTAHSNRIKAIVTAIIVFGAAAWLIFSTGEESVVYYRTVTEVINSPSSFTDHSVRINGLMVKNSLKQKPGTSDYVFTIKESASVLTVYYSGIIPDVVQPGKQVMIEGRMTPDHSAFAATQILTKCPSKYKERKK